MSQSRFAQREEYQPSSGYRFLPFNFLQFDSARKLLVNEVGEYLFLENSVFEDFVTRTLSVTSDAYFDLKGKHFFLTQPLRRHLSY